MIHIDCKEKLVAPNKLPLLNKNGKEWTLGTALGDMLLGGEGDAAKELGVVKCYTLGLKFSTDDEVIIDEQDFEGIKTVLSNTQTAPILAGQILHKLILNNTSDVS